MSVKAESNRWVVSWPQSIYYAPPSKLILSATNTFSKARLKLDAPLVWAEIDVAAIAHNVSELRRITHPDAELMVAVKANGYGHGAVETARAALAGGATRLGVARVEEALELRKAGITAPIMVFGYTPEAYASELVDHDLWASVFSLESAQRLSDTLKKNQRVTIHLKVDTGMGRLGLLPDPLCSDAVDTSMPHEKAVDQILQIGRLENLQLEGIWTHFAASDEADKTYTNYQLDNFKGLVQAVEAAGLTIPIHHAANSGAIIDMPESHMDMVRAGIAVYGLYPSSEVAQKRLDLKPALQLKARILHLKRVPQGTKISYGCTWEAPQSTVIATIPVGYGDGYSRGLANRGQMLVGGKRAPIAGRVCMDLTMIDLGADTKAKVGDEVVIIGSQGDEFITADEIARTLNTINYEVVTTLMARVPREFVNLLNA